MPHARRGPRAQPDPTRAAHATMPPALVSVLPARRALAPAIAAPAPARVRRRPGPVGTTRRVRAATLASAGRAQPRVRVLSAALVVRVPARGMARRAAVRDRDLRAPEAPQPAPAALEHRRVAMLAAAVVQAHAGMVRARPQPARVAAVRVERVPMPALARALAARAQAARVAASPRVDALSAGPLRTRLSEPRTVRPLILLS